MGTVLIIIGIIFLIIISASLIYSFKIVYPYKQKVKKNPAEYGLTYEDVSFTTEDGLTIRGWLIPGKSDKLIIQTHPMGFNRTGFAAKEQGLIPMYITKTDVDLLTTSKMLNENGYSVLAFDFRRSGESDNGLTGVGLETYKDVAAAVTYIKSRPELAKKQLGFVSFCMGANSTIIALSKAQQALKDIRCAVLVQPISALVFMKAYIKKVFTPVSLVLLPFLNLFIQMLGCYPFKKMTPLPYTKDITIPVLYIQAKTDPWTELSDIEAMYQQTNTKKTDKELFFIQEKMDRFSAYNWVSKNPKKIVDFLKKYLT